MNDISNEVINQAASDIVDEGDPFTEFNSDEECFLTTGNKEDINLNDTFELEMSSGLVNTTVSNATDPIIDCLTPEPFYDAEINKDHNSNVLHVGNTVGHFHSQRINNESDLKDIEREKKEEEQIKSL